MNKLICHIQPFDYDWYLYKIDSADQTVDAFKCHVDDIVEVIPQYCKQNDVNYVRLYGYPDYGTYIKDKISEYCLTNYEYNNLNLIIDCGE